MDFLASLKTHLPEEEAKLLLQEIESGKVTHALLLNTSKISDEEFVRRYPNVKKHPFVEHAYLYDKAEYEFGKSILYDNGAYSIEDASAMMVNYFLKPEPGDHLLDICAAPGGKSIGAALMMRDKGVVVANDISYPRAKSMSQNVERMGLGNIIVASNDFVFSHIHFANSFDKIIVDAPCSGSAMMRKNALARADWKMSKVISNALKQQEILELAYGMLKEGGTLSYSTCSFSYEENEATILAFKEKHPEIEILPLEENPMFYRHKDLPEAVRLHPNHFPGEGQFICLFKKPGTLVRSEPEYIEDRHYRDFLEHYRLENRSNELMRQKFYSLSEHFDTSHLNILRYGVKLFEMRAIYIPDHHLTHYLGPEFSIEISKDDAKAYIHGDTFPMDKPDGYYIVSYDKMNLGFVKVVQGTAKNHYPKGLRREWHD